MSSRACPSCDQDLVAIDGVCASCWLLLATTSAGPAAGLEPAETSMIDLDSAPDFEPWPAAEAQPIRS